MLHATGAPCLEFDEFCQCQGESDGRDSGDPSSCLSRELRPARTHRLLYLAQYSRRSVGGIETRDSSGAGTPGEPGMGVVLGPC